MKNFLTSNAFRIALKVILTVALVIICPYAAIMTLLLLAFHNYWAITGILGIFIIALAIPLIWKHNKKPYLIFYASYVLLFLILFGTQSGIRAYNDAISIDVTPNINTEEYLPFDDDSKIVKIESKTLSFKDEPRWKLPIIDGATAALPVYSAFVHALYPETTKLDDGVFEYNNTRGGYQLLARKEIDMFIGAYPSKEQQAYAKECGTTFTYTQIGSEAFVFFVHKDNPIDSLTSEQIRRIYAGEITNWRELGGKNKEILPFQRNEGSGSQSMMLRFMGDTPLMKPDTDEVVGFMGGIIEEVADYKNKANSIGFSFRYYVDTIIDHPDIKMIAVDGVQPTAQNIKNGTYPIIAPVYAVTYEGNTKENVHKLLDWILSDEGQNIIEETGYVGIR